MNPRPPGPPAAPAPGSPEAGAAAERHQVRAAALAAELARRAGERRPVHIQKGGEHHFVPLPGERRFPGRPIDVSAFSEILALDPDARTCRAEPGITFARLLSACLAHGLIPAVVPELEGITLGGAVAGCSIESMSYRHGGFHDTCLEYEVVSGAGERLTCSPERDPLLFGMLHGSYGTLGILTRLDFRLLPARPFVRLEYRRFGSFAEFAAEIEARCAAGDFDFVDAIVHGPDRLVVCLGRFAAEAPFTSDYRRAGIYYRSTLERREDYLTTYDYCFRYDTECHWLSRTFPPLQWRPVRHLAGRWLLGSTNLIRWARRVSPLVSRLQRRPDVVCDVFLPARRFLEFLDWYAREFRFYPLWVVPYRLPEVYPWVAEEHAARVGSERLFIDCAIYGRPNRDPAVDYSRLLEEKVFELAGLKTLIGANHYSRERFWSIYHRANYATAKARLDPTGVFPDVYSKMVRD